MSQTELTCTLAPVRSGLAGKLATAAILSLFAATLASAQPAMPPGMPDQCLVGPLKLVNPGACRMFHSVIPSGTLRATAPQPPIAGSSTYSVLYAFANSAPQGAFPNGGLIRD